jgi:vacuolar-type H+-ATPase subunit F/Vma7
MARVAAIGESVRISGFTLSGVLVLPADSPGEASDRWASLPGDVDLVILTAAAASEVGEDGERPLRVVMPP